MGILYIFIGGAFGALLRFIILSFFNTYPVNVIGVLAVNMLGCFIIGFVTYLGIKRHHIISKELKNALTVGFAGGFTTFSAFTHPVLEMFLRHHYIYALINMFLSVILGLIFVSWGMNCGYYLMNWLIRTRRLSLRQEQYD